MEWNKTFSNRLTSVILALALLLSLFSGCAHATPTDSANASTDGLTLSSEHAITSSGIPVDTAKIISTVSEEIIDEIVKSSDKVLSTNWEDYQGDLETFVYGLIINQLEYRYDVFPAFTDLLNGESVYGLAYTDYEECFVADDQSEYAFEAGFIPFWGEPDIPAEDFNSGLEIYNLDYTDSKASFFMAYGSDTFKEHCVVYGQYLQYGIDDAGKIFYDAKEYVRGECDESIGSLYSYDEARYVFDVDVGEYIDVTGTSLNNQVDYKEIEAEINRILEIQDVNFVSVDVTTNAYVAQEAVISYLLSLQEESFLGYSVNDLVNAANELDPLECYRITADGIEIVALDYDGGASEVTRWLVGTCCVIVTAVAMVGSVVFIECPPLSALAGAMAGTAIDIFMQVVISGETLDNLNWGKVALAAATGAVSGFLGPYICATTEGLSYFVLDTTVDGLVGGIEYAVNAWIEGEQGEEIIERFGYGFALGIGLSAGFKAAGYVVSKIATKVTPSIIKLSERVFPKLTGKVSALFSSAGATLYSLKKAADSTIFHSDYISRKIATKQLQKLIQENSNELTDKAFNALGREDIIDAEGNALTKDALKELFTNADNGTVLAKFRKGDELVDIVKENNTIGIMFDPTKYQTVEIPGGLSADRGINFEEAATILRNQWLDDPAIMPESIALALRNRGKDLEDLMPSDLVSIIQKSDWVIHENIDMRTITLVSRSLHEEIKHMGGIGIGNTLGLGGESIYKYLKSHMGQEFFDRLVSAAASNAVIAAD